MATPSHRWRYACLLLIVFGAVCTGYLLKRSFVAITGRQTEQADVCEVIFGSSCDAATQPSESWLGEIPPAGWGVVFYATTATLLILGWTLGEAFTYESSLAASLLSLCAAGIGVGLLVVAVVGQSLPICPLCILIHAINLALVFSFKRLATVSFRDCGRSIWSAIRYVFGAQAVNATGAAWQVVGLLNAALVATVAYQWVYVEISLARTAVQSRSRTPAEIVADFEAQPRQEVPISDDDAHYGSLDAPVRLVVFSSFQCPACQRMSHQVASLPAQFGDGLVIVFKHYPLGTSCNPHVEFDQHPLACEVAEMAEAARDEGNFWKFHNAMFAAQPLRTAKHIDLAAENAGLDAAALRSAGQSKAASARVQASIVLGKRLGVDATPTLFLNGRRLKDQTQKALVTLVKNLLPNVEQTKGATRKSQ